MPAEFRLKTSFEPKGDQPRAIEQLMQALDATRKLTRLGFGGVAAHPLGPAGSGAAALARDTARGRRAG